GRLLRLAPALSERRLLLRADLQGDGLSHRLLHRPVRARPAARLDRAVGGDAERSRPEDRAAAPALRRRRAAAVRAARPALSAVSGGAAGTGRTWCGSAGRAAGPS